MPSFRAFEVLIAVAEESSISRAARRLHLSQPAVSHQLSALEKEVAVPLVDRGPRGVTLTAEGRDFLVHARRAVESADKAVAAARAGSAEATVRLAVAESFTMPFVIPVARQWNAERRTPLEFTETAGAGAVIDALRSGDQDLVIVPGPVHAPGLHVEVLGTEPIVAVIADGHPLMGSALTLEDVAANSSVGVDDSNGFAAWIANRFAEAGVAQRSALRTRSLQNAASLAAAGFGIAVVPLSAVEPGTGYVELEPHLTRHILAVTRVKPRATIADLVNAIGHRVSEVTEAPAAVSPS